jgi:hypothetical protein
MVQPETLAMNGAEQRITVVDLRIPFFRLVFFFVKAALAIIPAAIILTLIFALLGAILGMIWGMGNMDFFMRRWMTM